MPLITGFVRWEHRSCSYWLLSTQIVVKRPRPGPRGQCSGALHGYRVRVGPPRGHVELREDRVDALAREIREELGIEISKPGSSVLRSSSPTVEPVCFVYGYIFSADGYGGEPVVGGVGYQDGPVFGG